ncbi:MAG TPA: hypothetical protein V6D14_00110 [Coleofasciculaceae cyanobacterium]
MSQIRDLVQQAIAKNYLTVESEEQLRRLLQTKYEKEDLKAFMKLQQAMMEGFVRQESRCGAVQVHDCACSCQACSFA